MDDGDRAFRSIARECRWHSFQSSCLRCGRLLRIILIGRIFNGHAWSTKHHWTTVLLLSLILCHTAPTIPLGCEEAGNLRPCRLASSWWSPTTYTWGSHCPVWRRSLSRSPDIRCRFSVGFLSSCSGYRGLSLIILVFLKSGHLFDTDWMRVDLVLIESIFVLLFSHDARRLMLKS